MPVDLLTLLIVIVLLLWLFGYFGRGRLFGRGGSVDVGPAPFGGSWIHTLLVIVLILVVLRLLRVL